MNVLLHICCGICAGSVAEKLLSEGHRITGYFFNPNIQPAEEYQHRLEIASRIADWLGFQLEVGPYEPQNWLEKTLSMSAEPEGGKRCTVCYQVRLQAVYQQMKNLKLDAFTTTLTVSPHKSAAVVNKVGLEIGGEKFLVRDFKKQDGFKRASEIAKQLCLYRQEYCGCVYSLIRKS